MPTDDKQGFVDSVMKRLPTLPDENDRPVMVALVQRLHDKGFTASQALEYALCMEEVDPDLDETVALETMSRLEKLHPVW